MSYGDVIYYHLFLCICDFIVCVRAAATLTHTWCENSMELSLPYDGEIPRAIPCNSSSQLGSTAEKEYGEGQVELDRIDGNLGILLNVFIQHSTNTQDE